jgi:hypothetical protein
MNSALVGLMMQLMHSGDDKKRQAEYDRRQKETEDRQNRMLIARDAIAQQREESRVAAEHAWQVSREDAKQKAGEIKDKNAREQEHVETQYGIMTIKQNAHSGVPFSEWKPEEQEAVLRLTKGNYGEAEKIVERVRAGATVEETKAAVEKAKSDAATNEAEQPYIPARVAAQNNLAIATAQGGGRSPADTAGAHNLVSMNSGGGYAVSPNPFNPAPLTEEEKMAKAMGTAGKSASGLPIADSIHKNTTTVVDGTGKIVEGTPINHFTQPSEPTPTASVRPPMTAFESAVNRVQEQEANKGVVYPTKPDRKPLYDIGEFPYDEEKMKLPRNIIPSYMNY